MYRIVIVFFPQEAKLLGKGQNNWANFTRNSGGEFTENCTTRRHFHRPQNLLSNQIFEKKFLTWPSHILLLITCHDLKSKKTGVVWCKKLKLIFNIISVWIGNIFYEIQLQKFWKSFCLNKPGLENVKNNPVFGAVLKDYIKKILRVTKILIPPKY